jgi:glyoxylase-like metal-dependent hydrolase (beta-lactamase superfamily II)
MKGSVNPNQALRFPFADAPAPGSVRDVAPRVKWLRMPLPFALDHVNLWVLEDDDGWTLVDFGIDLPQTRAAWERLLAGPLAAKPVKRLIATHFHPDHLGCGGWLARITGAPLWITEQEWRRAQMMRARTREGFGPVVARSYTRAGLRDALPAVSGMDGYNYGTHVGPLPETYHAIVPGKPVLAAGVPWQVVIGEGHSPQLATLHSPEHGVLISGDQVLPGISPNISVPAFDPDSNPLALFLANLERFRPLPRETLVLPSHKLPFRGLEVRIDQLVAHHHQRLEQVRAACRAGASAADVLRVIFPRALDPHQLSFALGETLAHLNYLIGAGEVRRAEGADGIDCYTCV